MRPWVVVIVCGLVASCSVGTGSQQVGEAPPAEVQPVPSAKYATRLRANPAATARAMLATTEYDRGALARIDDAEGEVVDVEMRPYVNRFGPDSLFTRPRSAPSPDQPPLEIIPEAERTALQQLAFEAWLQDPFVASVVEPQVLEFLAAQAGAPGG